MRFYLAALSLTLSDLERSITGFQCQSRSHRFPMVYISKSIQDNVAKLIVIWVIIRK